MGKKLNKKGDIPFWLVMVIIILVTMIALLLIITATGGKLNEFIEWLSNVF